MGEGKPKTAEQPQIQWDSSAYRKRKAARERELPARWIQNSETGERFLVRRLGMVSNLVARNMAALAKEESLAAWQQSGVELPASEDDSNDNNETREESKLSISQAERLFQMQGKVVIAACVVPRIVQRPARRGELDIMDLADSDLACIYRAALGLSLDSEVEMQGGDTVPVEELKSVPEERVRRFGTIARG